MSIKIFPKINDVAIHLRDLLQEGIPQPKKENREIKFVLLFAYNGTGKTRLSMAFKDLSKDEDKRDTLYFNAFTEDLFYWDNDLENDATRELRLNTSSRFFDRLFELEVDTRIRPLLRRYADFDFKIKSKIVEVKEGQSIIQQKVTYVSFEKVIFVDNKSETIENIKVSRGEENIFIWCFFLAVAQLAIDQEEGSPYEWVNYIYIDDPISSLDDNNVIAVASHLAQLLQKEQSKIKMVISTHHALFFNVMWNTLNERKSNPLHPYFLNTDKYTGSYSLRYTNDTPFFHHVALLQQLHEAATTGRLFTYHFNILRSILEKAASFHGFSHFSACIKQEPNDPEGILHARLINVLSHGNYSLFEPVEMLEENKSYFKKILRDFMENYRFNPELFPDTTMEAVTA